MIATMSSDRPEHVRLSFKVATALWGTVFSLVVFPALLSAQGLGREVLVVFPADTQQLAYLNLAQLRSMPEYPQIRQRLLNRQLRDFQDFLRSAGTDPDKDVDEVALGWRGEALGGPGFFGRAEGRFDPERVHKFFVQQQLPVRQHAGLELYAFGSGEDPADVFFAFLNSSSAAFGRLRDLKEMLDVRAGSRPALDTNSAFVEWEAELEGSAPQWGVATGKAAANAAGPWLAAGGKVSADPGVMLGPVRAVLYRVDWGSGITAHVSIVCQNSETAAALSALLTAWRDSRPAAGTDQAPAAVNAFLQGLEIQASGSRVELTASGPMEAVDQILRGSMGGGGL
jgi:hypothetical protein